MRLILKMTSQQTREDTKQKEEIVYKFSNKGSGQLREAVIIEGKPYFLRYVADEQNDFITSPPCIEEETRKLVPPHEEQYPYDAYNFTDVREPNYLLERAKKETIDSLYQKIKNYVSLFNDVYDKTLNL